MTPTHSIRARQIPGAPESDRLHGRAPETAGGVYGVRVRHG